MIDMTHAKYSEIFFQGFWRIRLRLVASLMRDHSGWAGEPYAVQSNGTCRRLEISKKSASADPVDTKGIEWNVTYIHGGFTGDMTCSLVCSLGRGTCLLAVAKEAGRDDHDYWPGRRVTQASNT